MNQDIRKTVLEITVLHKGPLEGCDLDTLNYEITEGEWLGGGLTVARTAVVEPQDVPNECKALGNDGTFFSWPDDEDYDDQGNLKPGVDHNKQ